MNASKQIIIIHYTLPPVIGEVESMIQPLAEAFAQNGYLVTLLAGEGKIEDRNIKTSIIPELSPNDFHIRDIQRILNMGSLPELYEQKLENLQRKIETEIGNINNVIIYNIMTMPFNLLATEALWHFITENSHKNFYIWTYDLAWLIEDYKKYLHNRRPWSLLKSPIKNVKYITVSEFRKRQIAELMNIPKREIGVIPNVIKYQDFLHFTEGTSKIVREFSIFERYPVILIPVRIVSGKNLERTIKILASLKNQFPDMLGIVTGLIYTSMNEEMSEHTRLIKKLATENNLIDKIIFLDQILEEFSIPKEKSRDVVRDLYFVSHLVMLLSIDEGFGLPILEAGVARTPLAVVQIPVFREVAKGGALYLPLDESENYNAKRVIEFLNKNNTEREALFHSTLNRYNWDNLWDDYLKEFFNR